MPWRRSLYWRIAIGFVLGLAAMLIVQAILFIWVTSRAGPTLSGQPPDRFASTVSLDLSEVLARDPTADIERYVREQYAEAYPFFVLMADGRTIASGDVPLPDPLMRQARMWLAAQDQGGSGRERRFGRGMRPGPGPRAPQPITVGDEVVGVVVVPPRVPFRFLLARYAPTLAVVGAGVLVVGAAAAALLVFGPARRRLLEVEAAARQLGSGDLTARAPAHGGDEVAAVAAAFNAMADDLAARAEALNASDHARRQLLADVSHELTTPITAMRGYLETLMMPELALDDRTRGRYLQVISDETSRLERIVGDLLEIGRLGGGGALSVTDVAVEGLFERVRARHERAFDEAGVRFQTAVERGAESVRGDGSRLEQALQNLAANALRHAPRGSTIALSAQLSGDGVALSVSDEGPGIAEAHLPHIFDRFYKAEPSRTIEGQHATGSGLGLSIVKAIVERHGATISVTSRPGRTVFEIANLAKGQLTISSPGAPAGGAP
jgi:signal transduction histidine kinase